MTWRNRVVWSEGMFLRPQHFQQQARHVEALVEARSAPLRSDAWGFSELAIDREVLKLGRFALGRAKGLLPDGTPFTLPDDDAPPPPIDIPDSARDTPIYLALPLRQEGIAETHRGNGEQESAGRYRAEELEVLDVVTGAGMSAPIEVGRQQLRLLHDPINIGQYAAVQVCRVRERRADGEVVLDDSFIPPCLDYRCDAQLEKFVVELAGLLKQRGDALAARSGLQTLQVLRLQAVNRYEPLVMALGQARYLHPCDLHRQLLPMAGELATFSPLRRATQFPPYRHDDLQTTFQPVMEELRRLLSLEEQDAAIQLPLELRSYGIRVAVLNDRSLLTSAQFVLAVRAKLPTATIQKRFPAQAKLGSVERIATFVNSHLPGIGLNLLNSPPRELPYVADASYFALDQNSDYWQELLNSGGLALFIAGEIPGLDLALWAVRRRSG